MTSSAGVRLTIRRVLLVLGSIVGLWAVGLFLFAASLPRRTPGIDGPATDGIVVLTGGSERMEVAFGLLRAGKARKLLISGVHKGVALRDLLPVSGAGDVAELECCVVLGYEADNTEGNAVETARWVQREGFHSIRLVTANYHMPRSLVELRRALPGVDVVAHPVAPGTVRLESWWNWPGTAELIISEYNKYVAAMIRAAITTPPAAPAGRPVP